ncbi:hypothetical protein JCM4814A_81930 [Streptomyces phaeofaciens JCM 4814]|uniref:Uncharacterized protein n=1 Tax=Streptomyces phaeofaciens TaxID=68254 RepID=A0A918HPI4_9ACTN|nr:hypothetical protein [Streptomyces phaeofaciens]GGT89759.1 hypothetical protein GCM10010226_79950 [Streptomyces phaeofaciens]
MESGTIALFAAVVGVAGTLLAPVLSHRLVARVQREQFERQQQIAHSQWLRDQNRAELAQRRTCYAATNAAYRHYRLQLTKFLYHVNRGDVTEAVREELEVARHSHHAAYAEAQMVASAAVLRELDVVAKALSEGYRKTKCLEEGSPVPTGSFEEIHAELHQLRELWELMRDMMRRDLGIDDHANGPVP